MKAQDFVAKYIERFPESDQREALLHLRRNMHFFGEWIYALRLNTGGMISDATDARQVIIEIECAAGDRLTGTPPTASRFDESCPDCGHKHVDDKRCNFPYAAGRECACERKVSA